MGVKRFVAYAVAAVAVAVFAFLAGAVTDGGVDLGRLAQRFELVGVIGADAGGGRIAYADARGHVHVYRYDAGKPVFEWETTSLGSPAVGLFVKDVEGDGAVELIVATSGGRILFYDAGSYELLWENRLDPFGSIRCMLVDDIDDDPQDELVFVSGPHLVFFDGLSKAVEWKGDGFSDVRAMALGNTDDDEQKELVLSSGSVFDTKHRRAEFEGDEAFGNRIELLDLTGDGVAEVIAEGPGATLRVFDVYRRRELW